MTDVSGSHVVLPDPFNDFPFVFYKTQDAMRIEFGDLLATHYQWKNEKKDAIKDTLKSLYRQRAEEFRLKWHEFTKEVDEFLNE
jgi:hypothetical protein